MRTRIVELDDFSTSPWILKQLFHAKAKVPNLKITLFCLLSSCDPAILERLNELDWLELAFHGWNHLSEKRWDYWKMRHYLELSSCLGPFLKIFKMPWYDMPRLGACKALREKDMTLACIERRQALILSIMGNQIYLSSDDLFLLHPFQLPDSIDTLISFDKFSFVSERIGGKT